MNKIIEITEGIIYLAASLAFLYFFVSRYSFFHTRKLSKKLLKLKELYSLCEEPNSTYQKWTEMIIPSNFKQNNKLFQIQQLYSVGTKNMIVGIIEEYQYFHGGRGPTSISSSFLVIGSTEKLINLEKTKFLNEKQGFYFYIPSTIKSLEKLLKNNK